MNRFLNLSFLLVLLGSSYVDAKEHYNKKVNNVQVNASNGCIYFTLDGVSEADPVVADQPWITVAAENESKQAVLGLLMMAQASNSDVKVVTTGSKACGYAAVHYVRVTN